jgi:PAN domain
MPLDLDQRSIHLFQRDEEAMSHTRLPVFRLGAVAVMSIWSLACPLEAKAQSAEQQGSRAAPAAALPAATAGRFLREPNIDRSGNDIRSDKLPVDASVEDCERVCVATNGCVAYTFVKLSTTVPQPICWLKNAVPYGHASSCCTSGVLKN